MIEMFRIVFAQIRGLNFHTKPAATTACDTFSLFPRTVSFSTAHGLREGILTPNTCISSTCELQAVFTDPTHSSWHPLSHPLHSTVPCPLRGAPRGCPTAGEQHLNGPRAPGPRPRGVSLHPQWDSTTASQILWQRAKEKGHCEAKSLRRAGGGAGVEQEGETTGQTAAEGKEEEWDHRNSNNNSESHLETTAGNWVQAQAWAELPKPRPFIIQSFQTCRIWNNASAGKGCKPLRWLMHRAEIKLLLIIFLAIWCQQGSAGCRFLTLLRGIKAPDPRRGHPAFPKSLWGVPVALQPAVKHTQIQTGIQRKW